MAYVQKNNPIPKTGCGRRRIERMKSPFTKTIAKRDFEEEIKNKKNKVKGPKVWCPGGGGSCPIPLPSINTPEGRKARAEIHIKAFEKDKRRLKK
tara:strand:- start:570 stop:854 length:285 start_codon:yes stop_codon:yes gene_type:complete